MFDASVFGSIPQISIRFCFDLMTRAQRTKKIQLKLTSGKTVNFICTDTFSRNYSKLQQRHQTCGGRCQIKRINLSIHEARAQANYF